MAQVPYSLHNKVIWPWIGVTGVQGQLCGLPCANRAHFLNLPELISLRLKMGDNYCLLWGLNETEHVEPGLIKAQKPLSLRNSQQRRRTQVQMSTAKCQGLRPKWQWVQRGKQMNSVMWHKDSSLCQPMCIIVAPWCYHGVKNFPRLGGIIAIGLWLVEHRFELLPSRLSAILRKFRTGTIDHGESLGQCRVPDGTHRTGALKEACDVTCAEGEHGLSLAVHLDVQIISVNQSRRDGGGDARSLFFEEGLVQGGNVRK